METYISQSINKFLTYNLQYLRLYPTILNNIHTLSFLDSYSGAMFVLFKLDFLSYAHIRQIYTERFRRYIKFLVKDKDSVIYFLTPYYIRLFVGMVRVHDEQLLFPQIFFVQIHPRNQYGGSDEVFQHVVHCLQKHTLDRHALANRRYPN